MGEPGADRAADLAQIEQDLAEGQRQRDERDGTLPPPAWHRDASSVIGLGLGLGTDADLKAADLAQIERDVRRGE